MSMVSPKKAKAIYKDSIEFMQKAIAEDVSEAIRKAAGNGMKECKYVHKRLDDVLDYVTAQLDDVGFKWYTSEIDASTANSLWGEVWSKNRLHITIID